MFKDNLLLSEKHGRSRLEQSPLKIALRFEATPPHFPELPSGLQKKPPLSVQDPPDFSQTALLEELANKRAV